MILAKDKGPDRERTLNDITNTGVTAALIGGFALSNLHSIGEDDIEDNDALIVAVYMLSVVAVHACTCSCLTSAMVYRKANSLTDDDAPAWALANQRLLKLPWSKFVMGCSCYILSVIVQALHLLEPIPWVRYTTLAVGIMSMSTVVFTAIALRAL